MSTLLPAHNDATDGNHQGILNAIANRIMFCPAEERTARELEQMPMEDRERVWADMKGLPETAEYRINAESAEFLAERLFQLDQELTRIPPSSKVAFSLAEHMAPNYVNGISFRLRFLRADDFDTQAAAVRMVLHFQEKAQLFGPETLGRDIFYSDLSDDDIESLEAGGLQILSHHDRTERTVVFTRQMNYKYKERKNMVRNSVGFESSHIVYLCHTHQLCVGAIQFFDML